MHDGSIAQGDAASNLPPILSALGLNDVVALVWDEGNSEPDHGLLLLGPNVKQGHQSTQRATNYSLLRMIELSRLGVSSLTANDASASTLGDMFLAGG